MLYRINQIELTSGEIFQPNDLTVAIGPNNGGKSQFLKDLVSSIAVPGNPHKAVRSIVSEFPEGPDRAWELFGSGRGVDSNGRSIFDTTRPDFESPQHVRIPMESAALFGKSDPNVKEKNDVEEKNDAEKKSRVITEMLGLHLVAFLSTERRLLLGSSARSINKRALKGRNRRSKWLMTPIRVRSRGSMSVSKVPSPPNSSWTEKRFLRWSSAWAT